MNHVYLAGPLFTRAERSWNNWIVKQLPHIDWEIPQNFVDPSLHPTDIAELCLQRLHKCDAVLACLDGADADSGTCFEMGYAYSLRIPIIGYRTDFRQTGDSGSVNAMLTLCKELILVKEGEDVVTLLQDALEKVLKWPK